MLVYIRKFIEALAKFWDDGQAALRRLKIAVAKLTTVSTCNVSVRGWSIA